MCLWIHFILQLVVLSRVHEAIATELDLESNNETQNENEDSTSYTLLGADYSTVEYFEDSVENKTDEMLVNNSSCLAAILHIKNYLLGAGAVIGERWIIATAFQMGAFKPHQLQVRVGSHSPLEGGQLVSIQRMFSHPMFQQFNNDVALLKTTESVLTTGVMMIPLAASAPTLGEPASLLMWGESEIQRMQVDILPVTECRMFYPDFELTESNVCVVMEQALPFEVTFYGSPLVFNNTLVGHYMGLETRTFKPYLCSNLSPLSGWIHLTMTNESDAQLIFPIT